jgi:hypothetical protein
MPVAEAHVRSDRASRYLVQLCKHFSHKVSAEYDDARGKVEFQPGSCVMHAAGNRLTLRCEASNDADLRTVMDVVASHLARFAWQEELAVVWRDEAAAAGG